MLLTIQLQLCEHLQQTHLKKKTKTKIPEDVTVFSGQL